MLRRLVPVIALLLCHLFLRVFHITAQAAFMDEGFHAERAALVWHFQEHPGRFSDGKLLVYYWLGLFQGERDSSLHVSRTAIALFSLISGAVVYALTRYWHRHRAGLLALAFYAVLPLALFHERLALADPFAGALACLVAWRSLIFLRKPTLREGALIGLLLALATLAKLNMLLLVLLPLSAAVLSADSDQGDGRAWLRRYGPLLVMAAAILLLVWLPILIPAALAHNTDHPFMLLDNVVYGISGTGITSVDVYTLALLRSTEDYTGAGFWFAAAAAWGLLLTRGMRRPRLMQGALFLLIWAAALALPIFGFAALIAPRYLVPTAAPLACVLSLAFYEVWQFPSRRLILRAVLTVLLISWLASVALPFAVTAASDPTRLPLTGINADLFLQGITNVDDTLRQVARTLTALDPAPIYADRRMCRLVYFDTPREVVCLQWGSVSEQIAALSQKEGESRSAVYVLLGGIPLDTTKLQGLCVQPIRRFERRSAYAIDLWKVQRGPC